MPYTFTVLVTVLVSMHRYCTVCKPAVTACARISASAAAATRTSSRFYPSNAPQARHRVAVLAVFSVIYNIPRFFEYEPGRSAQTARGGIAQALRDSGSWSGVHAIVSGTMHCREAYR